MSEKTTLLPTAPNDERFVGESGQQQPPPHVQIPVAHNGAEPHVHHPSGMPMPRIIIVPGLEFDPARKFRYGLHSLAASVLILISFVLIELRNCNWSPGIDLDRLQALHVSLMVFAFTLYLLSLFGVADFVFQYKLMFSLGVLIIYTFVGLMVWMTYEAAVNPCVQTASLSVDLSPYSPNKNVFARGDGVGIIVLLIDIFATIFMISAAASFCKRY